MLLRLLRLRVRVRGRREVEGPFSVCIKIDLSTLFGLIEQLTVSANHLILALVIAG